MKKAIFAALSVVGIVLIIWGVNASESFSSDVSRVFTGSPTDKAVWLLVSGIIATVIGFLGLFFGLIRGAKGN
ncbi:MAG: DUF3185 family protein [Planctomycetota bacterium]